MMGSKQMGREEYAELVLQVIQQAQFRGDQAELVTELKRLTGIISYADPWTEVEPLDADAEIEAEPRGQLDVLK